MTRTQAADQKKSDDQFREAEEALRKLQEELENPPPEEPSPSDEGDDDDEHDDELPDHDELPDDEPLPEE